jgi:protein-tyrosine phosphatase
MLSVDFHSHILPGIDDGSKSVEESLELLRMEKAQGIGCVVATPHFYPNYDSPGDFLARRNRSEKQLREAMAKEDGLPDVIVGAEVYFFRGMSQSELIPELTIGEKGCILIEMPPAPWSEEIYRELENIWEKWGITPIVAHIDRYIRPFRTYGIPKRLSRLPVLVQANAEFFLEKATAGMALRMLKAEQIQLLGSDCHNLSSRKPNLGDAVEQIRRKLGDGIPEEMRALANEILGV